MLIYLIDGDIMNLYDKNGNKIKLNMIENSWETEHSKIYKLIDNSCIKTFKDINHNYDEEAFKILMEIDSPNFYHIYKLFYNIKKTKFKGYQAEYYKQEQTDILTLPTYYTLDNLYNLKDLFKKLTEKHILVSDTHEDNVILQKSRIIIIDADLYTLSKLYDKEGLERRNLNALTYLFKALYYQALWEHHSTIDNYLYIEIINKLFNMKRNQDIEETYKKLAKYKYPIDFLRKNI